MTAKELRTKVKAECAESPAFQKWLSKLSGSTPITYRSMFYRFILHLRERGGQFSEHSPDDLIQFQKNAVGDDRYLLLDEVQEFSRNMKVKSPNEDEEGREARLNTKRNQYVVMCSFFKHNRAPFPSETFSPSSETEPVRKDLTLPNVRDVILSSNHTYAAIFLCMFMGGMGNHELVYWSNRGWEDLKKEIVEGRSTYKIYIAGRKGKRNVKPFYTRVGGDAVDYLLRYIRGNRKKARTSFERAKNIGYIPNNEEFTPNVIFYTSHGTPIKKHTLYQYWMRRLFALGIITPVENPTTGTRYDNNIHQMRSLFRTQWGKSPVKGFIAESLMGHVVDPNDYLRTQTDLGWVAREYRRTLPFLNIMSSVKPYNLYEEEEVETIRDENKERIDELEARLDRTLEDIKTGKYDSEMMERRSKTDLIERIRITKSDLK
ncbi:hypothetical protein ES703_20956 [subsurface metagenome]